MAAFGKASEDLEDMAKKVTLAEQKLRDILADSKSPLEALEATPFFQDLSVVSNALPRQVRLCGSGDLPSAAEVVELSAPKAA